MQLATEWFKNNYKDKLDEDTYNNTTMFPIIWNIYESKWWSANFKANDIENHIGECLLPNITNSQDFIATVESLYLSLVEYREIRGYTLETHYYSLKAESSQNFLNKFNEKSKNSDIKNKLWILIWTSYRVRCNMFHGAKDIFDYEEIKKQKKLFEILNNFIVHLVILKRSIE